MKELSVRIDEINRSYRDYQVADDFDPNPENLQRLVDQDDYVSDGIVNMPDQEIFLIDVTSYPDPDLAAQKTRETLRNQYATVLDGWRHVYGDADIISDSHGGNMFAVPVGLGLMCFADANMAGPDTKVASAGWTAWFEDENRLNRHVCHGISLEAVYQNLRANIQLNWRDR